MNEKSEMQEYGIINQLVISMRNQLLMGQTWSIFKQTHSKSS